MISISFIDNSTDDAYHIILYHIKDVINHKYNYMSIMLKLNLTEITSYQFSFPLLNFVRIKIEPKSYLKFIHLMIIYSYHPYLFI